MKDNMHLIDTCKFSTSVIAWRSVFVTPMQLAVDTGNPYFLSRISSPLHFHYGKVMVF